MTSFVLPSEIQIQQKINQNMLINVLLWSVDELDHTKGVIRIRKSKDRQHNDKKKRDQERSNKSYTENERSSNTNNRGELHALEG